ncbi:MAG: hypothetical protein MZW92_69715 [Comamonadaceae bacterium]|nr:hypothetical protein [Comamonadaceae bacterium]
MPRAPADTGTNDAPRQQRSDATPGLPGAAGTLKSPKAIGKAPIAPGQPVDGEHSQGLATPHERDQSVGSPTEEPREVMEQARRDIESGQVDTDMRSTPGLDSDGRQEALRRGDR